MFVSKIFLNISVLSLLSANNIFINSPWANIEICLNCLAFIPINSIILSFTFFTPVIILSSYSKYASAIFLVVPSPVFFVLSYSGTLLILYSFPLCSNSSSTYVSSIVANLLLNDVIGLFEPLTSLNSAYDIASNIVVFPAPVSPVIKNMLFVPNFLKFISTSFLYGPNADIFKFNGFIYMFPF